MHLKPYLRLALLWLTCLLFSGQAPAYSAGLFTPPLFSVEANRKLPNKEILKLETDARGFIWVGTRRGVYRFDGYEYQPLKAVNGLELSKLHVRSLLADGNFLWIGTMTQGVYRVDLTSLQATRFSRAPDAPGTIGGNQVNAIKKDRQGRLWFAHDYGLDRWDWASASFQPFRSLDKPSERYYNYLLDIEFDANDDMWLSTAMGLATLAKGTDSFALFAHEGELLHKVVLRRLLLASDGRLWLASQNQGSYILDPVTREVIHVNEGDDRGNAINTGIAETFGADGSRRIWLSGTKGVEMRDGKTGRLIKLLQGNLSDRHGLAGDIVYSITSSASGTLWLGVLGEGLQYHPPQAAGFAFFDRFSPTLKDLFSSFIHDVVNMGKGELLILTEQQAARLNLNDGSLSPFSSDERTLQKLLVTGVKDNRGEYWFGGDSGNLVHTNAKGEWLQELALPLTKNQGTFVKSLALGPDGVLWAGSDRGLVKVSLSNQDVWPLKNADGSPFISFVRCLFLDRQNRLWVGTQGGLGLVLPGADKVTMFKRISGTDGSLRHNQINQILSDSHGNLLVVHPEGIDKLTPANINAVALAMGQSQDKDSGALPYFSPFAEGITAGMTEPARLLALADGRLWLGNSYLLDTNGKLLAKFREQEGALDLGWGRNNVPVSDRQFVHVTSNSMLLVDNNASPSPSTPAAVAITQLQFGSKALPFDPLEPILDVGADEQQFSVHFASPGATAPDEVEYRYRLDGYDRDWLSAPADIRLARYTSLSPGDYLLRLQAREQGANWGPELPLKVSIAPKYHQTLWFRLLVAAIIFSGLYGLFRWRLAHGRRRQLAQFERRDALRKAEMLSELMEQKNRVLAEVSHDLRTPLAMIKLQLEAMQDGLLQSSDATFESLINSLGNLNRMVGDIVQLSAQEGANLAMSKQPMDLGQLLEAQLAAFTPLLAQKGISASLVRDTKEPQFILADKDRLEQVLGNLLKNSYRYTAMGGRVRLSLKAGAKEIEIRIEDSAPGVPETELERLFERLYRGSSAEGSDESGSGLGLWICRAIIQAHGGVIAAVASPLGGLSVSILLPRQE
ncbi:two-component regulator propeller domain-containing protein [Shewanella salipaludis]|uniref:histidine kinase n=1 Tax=Shewanella salipaludis TaxID=2723052 RepID=A0A972FUC0_9GAMM|nr:two-component regulator propeller domain-containing protein [Shewanella salipaludis]NMH66333.1 hypothetical protein [Shewanella salipaludis]